MLLLWTNWEELKSLIKRDMTKEELIKDRAEQLKIEVGHALSKVECEQFVGSCVYGALNLNNEPTKKKKL